MRLPTLALVGGVGLGQEALLRDSETGSFGAGMTDAVLAATDGLQFHGTPWIPRTGYQRRTLPE